MSQGDKKRKLSSRESESSSGGGSLLQGVGIRRTVMPTSGSRVELDSFFRTIIQTNAVATLDADEVLKFIAVARKLDMWDYVRSMSKNSVWAPIFLRKFGPTTYNVDEGDAALELLRRSSAWRATEQFMEKKLLALRQEPSIETGTQQFIQTVRDMGPDMPERREVRRVNMPVSEPVPRDETTLYKAWYEYMDRIVDKNWKNGGNDKVIVNGILNDDRFRAMEFPVAPIPRGIDSRKAVIGDIFAAYVNREGTDVHILLLDDNLTSRLGPDYEQDAVYALPLDIIGALQIHGISDVAAFGNLLTLINQSLQRALVLELDIDFRSDNELIESRPRSSVRIANGVVPQRVALFDFGSAGNNYYENEEQRAYLTDAATQVYSVNQRLMFCFQSRLLTFTQITYFREEDVYGRRYHHTYYVAVYTLGKHMDEGDDIDRQPDWQWKYDRTAPDQEALCPVAFSQVSGEVVIRDPEQFGNFVLVVRLDGPNDAVFNIERSVILLENNVLFRELDSIVERSDTTKFSLYLTDTSYRMGYVCAGDILAIPIAWKFRSNDRNNEGIVVQYFLYLRNLSGRKKFHALIWFDSAFLQPGVASKTPPYVFGNGFFLDTYGLGNENFVLEDPELGKFERVSVMQYKDILKSHPIPIDSDLDRVIRSSLSLTDTTVKESGQRITHWSLIPVPFTSGDLLTPEFRRYQTDREAYVKEILIPDGERYTEDWIVDWGDFLTGWGNDYPDDLPNEDHEYVFENYPELEEAYDIQEEKAFLEVEQNITSLYILEFFLDFKTNTFVLRLEGQPETQVYASRQYFTFVAKLQDPLSGNPSFVPDYWSIDGFGNRVPIDVFDRSFASFAATGLLHMMYLLFHQEREVDAGATNGQFFFGGYVGYESFRFFFDMSRSQPNQYLKLVSGKLSNNSNGEEKSIQAKNNLQLKK